jgi:hypothetical protein
MILNSIEFAAEKINVVYDENHATKIYEIATGFIKDIPWDGTYNILTDEQSGTILLELLIDTSYENAAKLSWNLVDKLIDLDMHTHSILITYSGCF